MLSSDGESVSFIGPTILDGPVEVSYKRMCEINNIHYIWQQLLWQDCVCFTMTYCVPFSIIDCVPVAMTDYPFWHDRLTLLSWQYVPFTMADSLLPWQTISILPWHTMCPFCQDILCVPFAMTVSPFCITDYVSLQRKSITGILDTISVCSVTTIINFIFVHQMIDKFKFT